ncbi:MAG: hypothetical protein IPJ32_06185 [Sphingobacteriaceae bacterium]|nr:hypothetical protein [Sphingobacteriaceae bacterium]
MKKLLSIIFLFSYIIAFSQQKAKIGMSLEEAKKLFPTAKESKYEQETNLTIEEIPFTV